MHQGELLPIEHRSLQPKRLRSFKNAITGSHVNCEAIWAGEWRRINKEIPHLLGLLLAPYDAPRDYAGRQYPVHVTRRDASVAASIIQWLGTNVGNAFVHRCQQRVDGALTRKTEIGVQRAVARRWRHDTRTAVQRRRDTLNQTRKRLAEATK